MMEDKLDNKQPENVQTENKESKDTQPGNAQTENKESKDTQTGNAQTENKESKNTQPGNAQTENKESKDTQTENEKREKIVNQLEKSIFVEAGAGAGKTTLIVKRITNQIRKGYLKPEELVVITFTNKAAGELLERIQSAFKLEEENAENSEEEKARFTYAIEHLEQMHISTIHSFCFSLLQERCFEAKLPLGVSILENADTIKRQKNFFEKWFAQLPKSDIEEIQNALYLFSGQKFFYKDKVGQIFQKICEKPMDINFVTLTTKELKQLEMELLNLVQTEQSLHTQLNTEICKIADKGKKIFETHTKIPFHKDVEGLKLKSFYEHLDEHFLPKDEKNSTYKNWVKKIYKNETQLCNKGTGSKAKTYKEANEEFGNWLNINIIPNNTYEQWKNVEEKLKEKKNSFAYYTFLKYAIEARNVYLEQLEKDNLSNDQLIQKAKDLIWNSEEACEYFRKKYKCIYVDEFQDTDHIQADFIWKLACDEKDKLKKGALFVVGDPKQAIYRFRGGEPAVYNQIKQKMQDKKESAEVYELDNNYRSNEILIEWVNKVFKNPITDSGIKYRDMLCVLKEQDNTQSQKQDKVLKGVYTMPSLPKDKKLHHKEKVKYEAAVLTDLIQQLVSQNYKVYETKKTTTGSERILRPIHYGDFLILCKDTREMDYYIEKMKEAGISVDLAGKTDIKENDVLRNFLALYRFLLQPYDQKSCQGARQVVSHDWMSTKDEITKTRLKFLRIETKEMTQYGKAEYLLRHMEYLVPWKVEIKQEELYTLQARLHQMVESVFAINQKEPEHILKAFETYISTALERELCLKEEKKAVRFMNVHKAKGLEGVITIITNRRLKGSKEFIPDYTSTAPNGQGQYDYYTSYNDRYSVIHGYEYDANSKNALKQAQTEESAEDVRLEYVAATRAKEVLIVMQSYGAGSFLSAYENSIQADLEEIMKDSEKSVEQEQETQEVQKVQEVGRTVLSMPIKDQKLSTCIHLSPSDLEVALQSTQSREEKKKQEEHSFKEEKKPEERRPKGNIFGITMHRCFELFIKKEGTIETCVNQAIIENIEDLQKEGKERYLRSGESEEVYLTAVKKILTDTMKYFEQEEAVKNLFADAKAVYTELPFSYYTSKQENPKLFEAIGPYLEKYLKKEKIEMEETQTVWINGTADLVIEKNDGTIRIIDFKSDTKHTESMEEFEAALYEKYKGQLILYQYSMSRIFGVDIEKIFIHLYHLYEK